MTFAMGCFHLGVAPTEEMVFLQREKNDYLIMDKITIHDIPRDKYEGYIWYSDSAQPTVFIGDEERAVEQRPDAFIIEGLLWCPAKRLSYKIFYHDGQQLVREYQISDADLEGQGDGTIEEFIAHRIPGVSRLSFIRYWHPEKDENCENFEVLVPEKLVFVGFNNMK